jgi:hypothetical protein
MRQEHRIADRAARHVSFLPGRVEAVDHEALTTDVLTEGQTVLGTPGFSGAAAAGQEVTLMPVYGRHQVAGGGGYWTPRTSDE